MINLEENMITNLVLDEFVIELEPCHIQEGFDIHGNPAKWPRYHKTNLSKELRKYRINAGLSLGNVAKMFNSKPSIVSGLEFGKYRFNSPDIYTFVVGHINGAGKYLNDKNRI